jgi:CheY-like chemotaxis protein
VGTTVRIYLPSTAEPVQANAERWPSSVEGGRETVLLVEDEPAVLRLGAMMLERLGYQVLLASSPAEAIGIAEAATRDIDLLLTDVVLPGMDGRRLAKILASNGPNLRCLFASGYPADAVAHHGVLDRGINFLQKPFSQADLATAVRAALEGAPAAAADGWDESD